MIYLGVFTFLSGLFTFWIHKEHEKMDDKYTLYRIKCKEGFLFREEEVAQLLQEAERLIKQGDVEVKRTAGTYKGEPCTYIQFITSVEYTEPEAID